MLNSYSGLVFSFFSDLPTNFLFLVCRQLKQSALAQRHVPLVTWYADQVSAIGHVVCRSG
jgi:hypothetical protein